MKKAEKRLLIALLCVLIPLVLVSLLVYGLKGQKENTVIPHQGVFSHQVDINDPEYDRKKVLFSLLDTGEYYIMTENGQVRESGRCDRDENGIGRLRAEENDPLSSSENGYFIRMDSRRYLLISRAGEILYMQQTDEGGRLP